MIEKLVLRKSMSLKMASDKDKTVFKIALSSPP